MALTYHPGYGPGTEPDHPHKPLSKVSYIGKTLTTTNTSEQLWEVDRQHLENGFTFDLTTDKDCFLAFNVIDGELDATNSFELGANESYSPALMVVLYSIRFRNKNSGETPHVRGVVWGT